MFKIIQPSEYSWNVTVELPMDGGRVDKQSFDGIFKRISQSRLAEIQKQIEAGEIRDVDLAREVLVGWKGVVDSDGNDVPFSESARDQLLDISMVATGVVISFMQSLTGAKRKN
jgi:hypothetical protein